MSLFNDVQIQATVWEEALGCPRKNAGAVGLLSARGFFMDAVGQGSGFPFFL